MTPVTVRQEKISLAWLQRSGPCSKHLWTLCRDITGFIAAQRPVWGWPNSDGPLWGLPAPYLGAEAVAAYVNNVSAYIDMLRCEPPTTVLVQQERPDARPAFTQLAVHFALFS